jgi:hypothetical protein
MTKMFHSQPKIDTRYKTIQAHLKQYVSCGIKALSLSAGGIPRCAGKAKPDMQAIPGSGGHFHRTEACVLNPLHADKLSPDEQQVELGRILAAGLSRMWAVKSTPLSSDARDSFVEFSLRTRGCVGCKPSNRVGGR